MVHASKLFGREDAAQIIRDVVTGGGSAVFTGSSGAGKSSLLGVAANIGRSQRRRVLSVTPTEFERGLPFAGLAELIAQCPPGADSGLSEPLRRALAVAVAQTEPVGEGVDPLAVPLAIRGLLTGLCRSEPVVILLDDLQWLDPASLGTLGFALRRLSTDPGRLSVVVATRPDPQTGTDLIRCLPEPRHDYVVRPLDDGAIGQLLRERLGPRWTPPESAGVARASAGNPLLALEIARALQANVPHQRAAARHGHDPVLPVPSSLAELLSERVALLSQEAHNVLLLASAAGRLTLTHLQRMVEPDRLASVLETASDADVATIGVDSTITFTHPLLASAIYEAAKVTERRHAHGLLAQTLDDPVERARHHAKATTAPDRDIADELERAADISRGRGAPQLAGELLEAAALATPPETTSLPRWLRAVGAYVEAGDPLSAQAALDRGSTLAKDAEQQAEIVLQRSRLAHYLSGTRSFAEQAYRMAPSGSAARVGALRTLSTCHRLEGRGRLALRMVELTIREAAALNRPDIALAALGERQAIEWNWGCGQPNETLRELDQLAEDSCLARSPAEVAWSHCFYAAWDDTKSEARARKAIAQTIEAGRYGDLASLYICLILALIRGSRVRDAAVVVDEADRLGAWSGHTLQEAMGRILVRAYAGDLDDARALAEAAATQSRNGGLLYWLGGFLAQLGFIATSARDWQAALVSLRELAQIFDRTKMVDLEQLLWAVDYADAALQVGALDEVETAIGHLRRQGAAGRPEAAIAAARCQALLTAADGDTSTAINQLRDIVERPGSECPFEAARSQLALGQTYRRARQKALSYQMLTAAADAFDELGVPRWAERARDEANRVGLRFTTDSLTETERRIAELVGSGHSNQEAAAELFISAKTVEANLTRIYRKLSVRSRTELANRLRNDSP